MTKVRGEQRELGPEIDSFLIPRQEPPHGKGMEQIMNARPGLSFGATEVALSQYLQKDARERSVSVFGAAQINENGRSRRSREPGFPTLPQVDCKLTGGGRGDWNITRFIELSLLDQEN